jgi:hypothetical protein
MHSKHAKADSSLRRLPKNPIPDSAEFAGLRYHNDKRMLKRCGCCRDNKAGGKDRQDGVRFNSNRLNSPIRPMKESTRRNDRKIPLPCLI